MKKLYNTKEEKASARRERRRLDLKELEANKIRRRLKKNIYNKTAREQKILNPEAYEKRLKANREWKKKNSDHVKAYAQINRPRKRETLKAWRKRKSDERKKLLLLMTPEQQLKFLAKEREARINAKRLTSINKAIAKRSEKVDELKMIIEEKKTKRQRLIIQAGELQVEKLKLEAEKLNRIKVDCAVAKIISHRQSRAYRYRSSAKTYMERVRETIDYYYQLVEENNLLKQAA